MSNDNEDHNTGQVSSEQGDKVERDIVCVLDTHDDTSDVILEVEGRQLHANRTVLAHYSPVFEKMFFSDFKEKSEGKVQLPDKSHKEMEKFFKVLYPQSLASPDLITDDDLVSLLTLANEYQAEQVKVRCQDYIGQQLATMYLKTQAYLRRRVHELSDKGSRRMQLAAPIIDCDRLLLYLWMCDEHKLTRYRPDVMSVLLEMNMKGVYSSKHYSSLSQQSKVDLLELMCRKRDDLTLDLTECIQQQQQKRQQEQKQQPGRVKKMRKL